MNLWTTKAVLWVCGILATVVFALMMAIFVKSAWQYLSLPLYGCTP